MAVTWTSPRRRMAPVTGPWTSTVAATAGSSRSVTGSPTWLRRPCPRAGWVHPDSRSSAGVPIDAGGDGHRVGRHDVAVGAADAGRPGPVPLDRHRRRPDAQRDAVEVDVGRRHPPPVLAPSGRRRVASGAAPSSASSIGPSTVAGSIGTRTRASASAGVGPPPRRVLRQVARRRHHPVHRAGSAEAAAAHERTR